MRQDSGPCNFSDIRENDLPHIYRALCGDPTMVPIRKGTKMAAGNQQKHPSLSLSFAKEA